FVVDTEGEKMSKSLGNVTNLPDLLDRYDARAASSATAFARASASISLATSSCKPIAAHISRTADATLAAV
ncbi:MAG: hypothetical protein EBZ52_06545, partial [Actinobacteria bacterium]|nr:hypothetical protein [Actinomycetota bacterium]